MICKDCHMTTGEKEHSADNFDGVRRRVKQGCHRNVADWLG